MPVITIADDDPMLRLVRFALEGDKHLTRQWLHSYFSPEPIDPAAVIAIGENQGLFGRCEVRYVDRELEPQLARISSGSDAIVCRRAVIGREVLFASPCLSLINRLGELPGGVDIAAAAAAGVKVNCIARPTLAYTAEHAVMLLLAAGKALVKADRATRTGDFDAAKVHPIDNVAYNWPGFPNLVGVYGRTVGIVGLGEVGTMVARRLAGFGARIVYTKPNRLSQDEEKSLGIEFRSFDDLLAESDYVSLHARALPETKHMFDERVFRRMKRTAIFVNTSRGSLVDEAALARALEEGWIAAAAIDTHAAEPRTAHDRLCRLDNIIMTPHIAGGSRAALLEEVKLLVSGIGREST